MTRSEPGLPAKPHRFSSLLDRPVTMHIHQMLRHTLKFRPLQVRRVERLTPHMQRVVFTGDDLDSFVSASPDDHVKLFFPNSAGEIVTPVLGEHGPEYPPGREYSPMRDYTSRHHDASGKELTIDFVLHGEGPASLWARRPNPVSASVPEARVARSWSPATSIATC